MRFTPIIKVVGVDCNLSCDYCFYESPERANAGVLFPLKLLEKLFEELPSVNDQRTIRVIWHGGEPTMAGLSYFQEAIKLQKEVEEDCGCIFSNSIQTNGTLLTDPWVSFFQEEDMHVGISLDGFSEIHNRYRKTATGAGTYEVVLDGVRKCLEAGIPFGCLATINEAHSEDGEELFRFFVDLGIKQFRVKPCYELSRQGEDPLCFSTTPEAYANLLTELFDSWIAEDDPSIDCGPVDDFLRGVLGQRKQQCVFKRDCHFFSFWPDGFVYPCETRGVCEMYLGNFAKASLLKLTDVWKQKSTEIGLYRVRGECKACSWFEACRGGCVRYDVFMGRNKNVFCSSRRKVYRHIVDYLGRSDWNAES